MKRFLLLFILFSLSQVACTTITSSSEVPQDCPLWTDIEAELCTLQITKYTLPIFANSDFELKSGQVAQFSIIGNEGQILEGSEIIVFTEDGENFDHIRNNLVPGLYTIRLNQVEEVKFQLKNPGSDPLTYTYTVVTPYTQ